MGVDGSVETVLVVTVGCSVVVKPLVGGELLTVGRTDGNVDGAGNGVCGEIDGISVVKDGGLAVDRSVGSDGLGDPVEVGTVPVG